MSRSAAQIEVLIRRSLARCSLPAAGLWCRLRYLFDESPRPGQLRAIEGTPIPAEVLADLVHVDVGTINQLIAELHREGLVDWLGPKLISQPLGRIASKRAGQRGRTRRYQHARQAGASFNTPPQNGVSPWKVGAA